MTLLLELPDGVQDTLAREAKQRGTTPEALALAELGQRFPPVEAAPVEAKLPEHPFKTTADVIAWWRAQGTFLAPEEYADQPDSPELARQIREAAWRRS